MTILIVAPTADQCVAKLGGGVVFTGWLLSSLPLFAIAGVFLQQGLLAWLAVKTVVFLSCFGAVLSNVLYAWAGLARFKWTLLIARSLTGLCACMLGPMYISTAVGIEKRSGVMLTSTACGVSAYSLGPFVAGSLQWFLGTICVESLVVDADTLPGWFMAILYLGLMVKVFLLFTSPPAER